MIKPSSAPTLLAWFAHALLVGIVLLGQARLARAQDFAVLHTFKDAPESAEGVFPTSLIQASDGNFYGTTMRLHSGLGVVFRMTQEGTVTVLEELCLPAGPLLQASDGNLYGASRSYVFRLTLDGLCTPLHTFVGSLSGAYPVGALIEGNDGNFYGATRWGGAFGLGAVYRMTPGLDVVVMHSFAETEGNQPAAGLIQATDGNFYGTTTAGDFSSPAGSVFKMAPNGDFTELHRFGLTAMDGALPSAPLMQARNGTLYGTTMYGGTLGAGTIFSISPGGTFASVYSFSGGSDGGKPSAPLIQTTDGRVYGMAGDNPSIFQLSPLGTVVVLHTSDEPMEAYGGSGVIQAADGNLYGTEVAGGAFSTGTIFRLQIGQSCVNVLELTYDGGTLKMRFTLKTSTPALWGTWLAYQNVITPLWSLAIPAVSPAISFDVPVPSFPHIGTVGVFTALATSAFDVCADWKTVDTE